MNVTIRPLVIEDAYTSVKWRNDPEVFKYTGNTYNHKITIESELDWIKRVISTKNEFRCAIIADDRYVGNIYLTDITDVNAIYHIFIGDKTYWGKGIAFIASQLILKYAFENLQLQSVNLKVNKNNVKALQLYKKIGFHIIDDSDIFYKMTINKDCNCPIRSF